MSSHSGQYYLEKVFGPDAVVEMLKVVAELRVNSNIPFEENYIKTGISFVVAKTKEIHEGAKAKTTLKSLVSESFGEAAIYKYNANAGII